VKARFGPEPLEDEAIEIVSPKGATEMRIILEGVSSRKLLAIDGEIDCSAALLGLGDAFGTRFQGFGLPGLHPWLLSVAPLGLQSGCVRSLRALRRRERNISVLTVAARFAGAQTHFAGPATVGQRPGLTGNDS
jgi:hypothetical protein